MFITQGIVLTENEKNKLETEWEMSVNLMDRLVNQPVIPGAVTMTIKELMELDNVEFNQTSVNPVKVKNILFKTDTGLLHNDFWLFNPVVLAKSGEDGKYKSIVSGRTRLVALITLCEAVGADINTTTLDVVEYEYDTESRLGKSIVAFNTNRTMTQSERERVVMSSGLNGELPTSFNAQGLKTKGDVKRHFKQVCLTEFNEAVETEESDYSLYLTENSLYRVYGYLFELIYNDYPETYKSLKSGYKETWESISWLTLEAFNKGIFLKENYEGNTARNRETLESVASVIYQTWRGIGEDDETEKDCSF